MQKRVFVWENGPSNVNEIVSRKRKGLRQPEFFPVGTLPNCREKRKQQESSTKGEVKIHLLCSSKKINFRKNHYTSAVNTYFWAWSNFNSFANFDSLMTNDCALESSRQEAFAFCHLVGGQEQLHKNNHLLRANQQ